MSLTHATHAHMRCIYRQDNALACDALEVHVDLSIELGSHSMRRVNVKSHDIVFSTLICYEECGFKGWSAPSASHFDV